MLYPNQTGSVHKEIIRLLSLYHRLKFRQMLLLFPQLSETAFHSILKQLQKQGRISLQESSVVHLPETECADGMEAAFDVLLDFLPEVTYHAPGEFPVTLTFFAREECYEVIWLPEGKELLVSHALSLQLRPPDNYQRLIAGRLPDVTAYCLPRNGKIHYYKKGLTYGPNHPEYPA